ncbi:MAG: beta-ketoacyl reductase, partial [Novosphingobium sp.]
LSDWSRRIGFFALAPGGRLVDLAQDPTPFALPPHCGRLVRIDNDLAVLREDMNYLDDLHAMFEGARPVIQDTQVFGCADLLADDAAAIVGQDWFELDVAKDNRPITVEIADAPHMDRSGTYLVTGGFSGLGRAVALWLADNGAGRIALAARRGIDTPGAFDLLDQLGERGALAEAYAADVSDADAVMELLRELHRPDAPLRGIYHAAGVIEDELVSDMTPTQVERVMGPKAGGAWALHVASSELDIELQQFVLFSSIANLVGNSRQANYCAANGFMDGLAQLRHSQGLPAVSINFGAIDGTGMLEADERVGQHLTQIGLAPLDVNVALRGLGRAIARGVPQVAIAEKIAWEKWSVYEGVGGASPAFAALVEESRAAQAGDASLAQQLHAAITGLEDAAAIEILRSLIADIIAAGLKTSADRLKPEQTFDSFGVDSLMTTEIQIQLDLVLGVNFSVVELLGSTTIAKLADKALEEIRSGAAGAELAA